MGSSRAYQSTTTRKAQQAQQYRKFEFLVGAN